MTEATAENEKYAHIDAADKQSVVEKCATVQKWLDDQLARQAEKPKNVDPRCLLRRDLEEEGRSGLLRYPHLQQAQAQTKGGDV